MYNIKLCFKLYMYLLMQFLIKDYYFNYICIKAYFDIFSDKMKRENLDDEDLIEMEFDSEMNDKVVKFYSFIKKLENQC